MRSYDQQDCKSTNNIFNSGVHGDDTCQNVPGAYDSHAVAIEAHDRCANFNTESDYRRLRIIA